MFDKKGCNKKYYIEHKGYLNKQHKKYYIEHKDQIKEYSDQYRKNNPEKVWKWQRQWRKNNPERARELSSRWVKNNPEKRKQSTKLYYENNRDKHKQSMKLWYKKNSEKAKEIRKRWRENNPEKIRKTRRNWERDMRRTNLKYNLSRKICDAIYKSLKRGTKDNHWETLVGYTLNDLIKRLKRTMPRGYSWQDYFEGKLHVDHIIPISAFNFDKPEHTDFKRCWTLSNLQLLPAKENLIKHNKLEKPFQPSLKF